MKSFATLALLGMSMAVKLNDEAGLAAEAAALEATLEAGVE